MASRELLRVPPDELTPDREQVRTEFDAESLRGLGQSLAGGQLQPVLAYRREGKLVILDGERRWRAAKIAKLASLDVLVIDDPAERGAIIERQLLANVRENLNPIERAKALKRLLDENGWTAARVSARLGISAANVSRSLALLELPADVQQRVAAKDLPASTAYAIARGTDPKSQSELAKRAADENLTRESVRGKSRARFRAGSASGSDANRVVAVLGGERSITLSGPGLGNLDQLIEWVEELLQRAKKARPRGVELPTFLALLRDEAKVRSRAS